MAVTEAHTIDFMSVDKPTYTLYLNMVEDRPWHKVDPSWRELAAKTNYYIGAIKSPDFVDQVPEAKGNKIAIRLIASFPPDESAIHALKLLKAGCRHYGIYFAACVLANGKDYPIDLPDAADESVIGADPPRNPWDQN